MDNRQSLCASISPVFYNSLRSEISRNGRDALNNRRNLAASLSVEGRTKEAKEVRNQARIMLAIARKEKIKL